MHLPFRSLTPGDHLFAFKTLLIFVLFLSAVASLDASLAVQSDGPPIWLDTVIVTDVTGFEHTLLSPIFSYGDSHKNQNEDYFEIVVAPSPRRIFRVHHSQVETASFETLDGNLRITVELATGQSLTGTFPDAEMVISGEGELDRVSLPIQEVKAMEFLRFKRRERTTEWIRMEPTAASSLWRERRQPGSTWTITDGSSVINARGFGIIDAYRTNGVLEGGGFSVDYGRSWREEIRLRTINIVRGADEQTLVNLDDIQSIEVIGRHAERGLEVNIRNTNGRGSTGSWVSLVALLFYADRRGESERGDPEVDDMLVWHTEYGYEGISLFPIRRIVLTRSLSGIGSLEARINNLRAIPGL